MNVDEVLVAVADGQPTGHPELEGQLPLPDPDDKEPHMVRQRPAAATAYLRLPCHWCDQVSLTPTADLLVLIGLDGLPCIVEGWCAHCQQCIDTPITPHGALELLMIGISAETHGWG